MMVQFAVNQSSDFRGFPHRFRFMYPTRLVRVRVSADYCPLWGRESGIRRRFLLA
jgi:hypothetical protein